MKFHVMNRIVGGIHIQMGWEGWTTEGSVCVVLPLTPNVVTSGTLLVDVCMCRTYILEEMYFNIVFIQSGPMLFFKATILDMYGKHI